MKRIFLFCIVALMTTSLLAQQVEIKDVHAFLTPVSLSSAKSNDTIWPPVFATGQICSDSSVYYHMPTGYLTGSGSISGYTLQECSQAFDNSSPINLTGALILVNLVSTSGSGTFVVKACNVDGSFKPTTALGNMDTVHLSDLTTGLNILPLTFSWPVSTSNNFALDIVFPTTAGDSICIMQTPIGCRDSLKDGYAYLKLSAAGWMSYKAIMAMQAPPKGSFDLFIVAIKSDAASIKENPLNATLSVYPNPADKNVTIASLSKINRIKTMNCLGQTISDHTVGAYIYNMNTSLLDVGIYIIQIETDSGTISKKITIDR
jgi:hypothetical protein